jgi:hypothetical protein
MLDPVVTFGGRGQNPPRASVGPDDLSVTTHERMWRGNGASAVA